MTEFNIEILSRYSVSQAQRDELDALDKLAFTAEMDFGFDWSGSEEYVILRVDGRLAAMVGMLERTVLVGGREVKVGGVGGVATHPDHRRRGYAGRLLEAAAQVLKEKGCKFAMLFCDKSLVGYYNQNQYHRVGEPLFIFSRGERLEIYEIKMVRELSGEEWPQGEIDLQGLPW
jgi:aminoglycoside 2'-N-acetyltransferase I